MNQRFRKSILMLACALLVAANAVSQEQPAQPNLREKYRMCSLQARVIDGFCMVSMVDLIANPELFDGVQVLVAGYVLWSSRTAAFISTRTIFCTESHAMAYGLLRRR
jgi:hypothetical protein